MMLTVKAIMILTILSSFAISTLPHASAKNQPAFGNSLRVEVADGSLIFAKPQNATCQIKPWGGNNTLPIAWSMIEEIKADPLNHNIVVSLNNGDQISGDWADQVIALDSAIGDIEIPTRRINHLSKQVSTQATNIALGKPVSGQDGASFGKGLAKHLTDGDLSTHTKPPASHFDYTVLLSNENENGYRVSGVKIHWGRFGDRFKGVRASDGNGWASAAWPAEYVTSYQLQYRMVGSDTWKACHSWTGRPVDEVAENVDVLKLPTDETGCSSNSITTLQNLELENVSAMRLQAKGEHWIGLYELEIFGAR